MLQHNWEAYKPLEKDHPDFETIKANVIKAYELLCIKMNNFDPNLPENIDIPPVVADWVKIDLEARMERYKELIDNNFEEVVYQEVYDSRDEKKIQEPSYLILTKKQWEDA